MGPGGVEETDVAEPWPAGGQRPAIPGEHLGARTRTSGPENGPPAEAGWTETSPSRAWGRPGPAVMVATEEPRMVRTSRTRRFPGPLPKLERAAGLQCAGRSRHEPGPNGTWARRGGSAGDADGRLRGFGFVAALKSQRKGRGPAGGVA